VDFPRSTVDGLKVRGLRSERLVTGGLPEPVAFDVEQSLDIVEEGKVGHVTLDSSLANIFQAIMVYLKLWLARNSKLSPSYLPLTSAFELCLETLPG
jgi:hypothetical protein